MGADALGHFSLNHHGHPSETAAFQQKDDDGSGNVVGKISAGHRGQALKFLSHQLRKVQFHHVTRDNFHVTIFPHGFCQNGEQRAV